MHDFTQRGSFVPTSWKQSGAAPSKTEWELHGIGLGADQSNVLLGKGATHADCLVQAQATLKEHYPGRFI